MNIRMFFQLLWLWNCLLIIIFDSYGLLEVVFVARNFVETNILRLYAARISTGIELYVYNF